MINAKTYLTNLDKNIVNCNENLISLLMSFFLKECESSHYFNTKTKWNYWNL